MTHGFTPITERHGRVQVVVPAEEEFVGVVRIVAGSAAASVGMSGEDVADLKVAVSEACTNAVRHAYEPGELHPDRTVEVSLGLWDGVVEVDVCDRGGGVQGHMPSRSPRLDRQEGGFGLTLIGCLMDSVELIDDCESGTRLKFLKRRAVA